MKEITEHNYDEWATREANGQLTKEESQIWNCWHADAAQGEVEERNFNNRPFGM